MNDEEWLATLPAAHINQKKPGPKKPGSYSGSGSAAGEDAGELVVVRQGGPRQNDKSGATDTADDGGSRARKKLCMLGVVTAAVMAVGGTGVARGAHFSAGNADPWGCGITCRPLIRARDTFAYARRLWNRTVNCR